MWETDFFFSIFTSNTRSDNIERERKEQMLLPGNVNEYKEKETDDDDYKELTYDKI